MTRIQFWRQINLQRKDNWTSHKNWKINYYGSCKMKMGKAAGPSSVVAEILKPAGETGIEMIKDLTNQIEREGAIAEDWDHSTIVNGYKGTGAALDTGNLKRLDVDGSGPKSGCENNGKTDQKSGIDEMQFGYTPGRGTNDAIFILRYYGDITC